MEEVTGDTAVDDLELILRNRHLSPAEQSQRLTMWLRETKVQHGGHIGEYAAALLTKTGPKENSTLYDLMAGGIDEKLTEDAQYVLLLTLFQQTRKIEYPRGDLIRILAVQTMHALFARQQSIPTLNRYQLDVVQNFLPRLIHWQQARTLLERDVLDKAQRARAIAALDLLNKNEGVSQEYRNTLADLRQVLQKK